MERQDQIEDLFLKALIKNGGLKTPSKDFTTRIMAKIPSTLTVVQESSRLIGKNLTLLIFVLVGIVNLLIIYFVWPYLSIWLPENSLLLFLIESANSFLRTYFVELVSRSATISLLFVIALGSITILGKDEIMNKFQRFGKKPTLKF